VRQVGYLPELADNNVSHMTSSTTDVSDVPCSGKGDSVVQSVQQLGYGVGDRGLGSNSGKVMRFSLLFKVPKQALGPKQLPI
jgi:hypothetical protein